MSEYELLIAKARTLIAEDKIEEAIAIYQKAFLIDSTVDDFLDLGFLYLEVKSYSLAFEFFIGN